MATEHVQKYTKCKQWDLAHILRMAGQVIKEILLGKCPSDLCPWLSPSFPNQYNNIMFEKFFHCSKRRFFLRGNLWSKLWSYPWSKYNNKYNVITCTRSVISGKVQHVFIKDRPWTTISYHNMRALESFKLSAQ